MVRGASGSVCGMSSAAGCVSGGFCVESSDRDVVGTDGCSKGGSGADGSVAGFGLGGGGGDGEWSGVIGVVGMWSCVEYSICGGEPSWILENRLSIYWLISSMFSSSSFLVGSLAGGGGAVLAGMKAEIRLVTT